ncbi:hypothetical protein [Hymenobacter koreensis]|uniref:Uncharacterized protein n=1 Tax=Hymenobacter koreensis TaxID=1084523 RepID=A0ABP8J209_9BACT
MEGFRVTVTKSLLKGWLASLPAFLLYFYFSGGDRRGGVLPWLIALGFVMVANVLFVQGPKATVLSICTRNSRIKFAVVSAAYAVCAFTVMIGWAFFDQPYTYLTLIAFSVIIGGIAGLDFYTAHRKTHY